MKVGLANSLEKLDYTDFCFLEAITRLYPRVDDT